MANKAGAMVLAAALAVLLLASAASAGRAQPAAGAVSPGQEQGAAAGKTTAAEGGECDGATDGDDCMMRRTLEAHTDYIYTQELHN